MRKIIFLITSNEPNLSAIQWLEKVMPNVWEIDPNISLRIAGRNPTKQLVSIW